VSALNFRKSFTEKLQDSLNIIALSLITIITLYPLLHELFLSLSSHDEAIRGGLFFWPREFTLAAYEIILGSSFIWKAFGNSIFVVLAGTLLSVLSTAAISYAIYKKQMPGVKLITFFVLFTMLFQGGLIPTFLVVRDLGLIDKLWALILINLVSPFSVFVMKSFINNIPAEMEECAFIDGANPIYIFYKIILPLSKAVLATISLWTAVGLWNDFFNPIIYLNSKAKFTMPLIVRMIIMDQNSISEIGDIGQASGESVLAAAIVVALIPIISVYPFLQRHFVKGVMLGSVKG